MLLKSHFLVKITHANFFFFGWPVKELKEKIKTEMIINKNEEYTTSLFIIFMSISRQKYGKKYFYLKTTSITP